MLDQLGMLPSIDFHDEASLLAQEIDYIRTQGDLATEFPSLKAARAQVVPEPLLRVGHYGSKLLRGSCTARIAKSA